MSTISAGVTVPTALNLSGDTTGALTFQVSGTVTAATISSAGNLGIGTASPDGKLDIATGGSGDVVAGLGGSFPAFTYRNGSGSWFHAGKSPSSDYFYIGYGATPTANIALVVGSAGQIGIGGENYGTSGQVLTSNGSGSAPSWQTAGGSSLKSQTFNSSGTFTVPTGVTSVWVTMTGGGGAGGASISGSGAPGGASGAYTIKQAVSVTAGASITVTIGGGGAGVAAGVGASTSGGRGGTTSFGSVSVTGGYGGQFQTGANAMSYALGGANGGMGFGFNPARPPGSVGGTPGLTGAFLSNNPAVWGGAGGLFGDGTDGNATAASTSAAANTGAGAGGANSGGATTFASGNGGSGRVIVEWLA